MTSPEMEVWAKKAWRLKGNMFCHPLNQNLFFMSFDSPEEAEWVMENGSRICRGEVLILERWNPSTGCMRSKSQNQEAWIRVVGLPLHLWTENILVTIENSCGGFVAIDKETSLMKNLFWARILVKMKSHGRPTTVNLLAGGRSYEIQIWWEIQPWVTEVYPRRFSRETEMANPREEDEWNRRAPGRVTEERGTDKHNPRIMHREVGQWQALHASGTEGILSQKLKCGGITSEGAISQGEIQNIGDERRSEEGTKLLRDVLGRNQGFHNGSELGQSPGRSYVTVVGQSPGRNNVVVEGQSQRQKMQAVRSTGTSRLESQESDRAGRMGGIERGSESLNLAKHQNPDILGVEEEGGQKMCRNGRKPMRDAGGNQFEKEISHHKLNRELKNGKATSNALISVDLKIGREKVYPVGARVEAETSDEQEAESRAGKRVELSWKKINDVGQILQGSKSKMGRKQGHAEADAVCSASGAAQHGKGGAGAEKRENKSAGPWANGEGLAHQFRPRGGPNARACFLGGLKGNEFHGPRDKLLRSPAVIKAGIGLEVGLQLQLDEAHKSSNVGAAGKKGIFGVKVPEPLQTGPSNWSRDFKRDNSGDWGLIKAAQAGPAGGSSGAREEWRMKVGGFRSGEGGSCEALVDPAWICARGPLLQTKESWPGWGGISRFEVCWEKELSLVAVESPAMDASGHGKGDEGFSEGSSVALVEAVSMRTKLADPKEFGTIAEGSRFVTLSSVDVSPPLSSVFGRPLLSGGSSGSRDFCEYDSLGDMEPLRVVSGDGREWGKGTANDETVDGNDPGGPGFLKGEAACG